MIDKVKDRHLPILEYLDILQREYLICDFRRKVYFAPSDKRYYKRVMDLKKEKILGIAQNNSLSNIFADKQCSDILRSKLFDRDGKPTFELDEKDKINYYNPGAYFKLISTGKVGKLCSVDLVLKKAIISFDNEKDFPAEIADLSRIL